MSKFFAMMANRVFITIEQIEARSAIQIDTMAMFLTMVQVCELPKRNSRVLFRWAFVFTGKKTVYFGLMTLCKLFGQIFLLPMCKFSFLHNKTSL